MSDNLEKETQERTGQAVKKIKSEKGNQITAIRRDSSRDDEYKFTGAKQKDPNTKKRMRIMGALFFLFIFFFFFVFSDTFDCFFVFSDIFFRALCRKRI